jgi:NADH-quinone oxidoreductase subunit C
MKASEILSFLQEKYPDQGLVIDEKLNDNCIVIPLGLVPEVFQVLQADPATDMDYFDFCTCVDRPPEHLHLVYSLHSMTHQHRVQLKVVLDRNNPCVPTVSHLWRNADWNEREVFDLFGVFFPGHSDLRRLMMPEDWEGHPLRKDYAHPNLVKRPD